MKWWRSDSRRRGPAESPWDECLDVTQSVTAKADKSKRRARVSTLVAIASSSAIPIFLGFGEEIVLLRVIPSVLAAMTVVISVWTGIERPHERWVLYRRYQRLLEAEQLRYKFGNREYADEDTRERKLAEFLAKAQTDLHAEWEGLIPKSTSVQDTTRAQFQP